VREWEKRLIEKKKQKILRIAGRIVELEGRSIEFGVRQVIDFSPTFMKIKKVKKNVS